MSPTRLFSKSKTRLYAVIDIGSYSIKSVIFEKSAAPGKIPKIFKKTALKLQFSQEPSSIVSKLREMLFAMVRELEVVPEKITVGIGPSLGKYLYQRWSIRPTGGEKIISKRELAKYFQNLFEQHRDPSLAMIAYPAEVYANGYYIYNEGSFPVLERSSIKEVAFHTLALVFIPEIGISLADTKRSLGGLPIDFIPLAAAEKHAVAEFLKISDVLLVDVGGEETTLVLLKEGRLAEVASFPFGGQHFLRGIAKIASISLEEAEDLKRQYAEGLISGAVKNTLSDFLADESNLWKSMFLRELDNFYPFGPLSKAVFLSGEGAYLPEISAILRSSWMQNFSYADSPEVRIIHGSSIFGGDSLGGFIQGPEDIGLASLITYSSFHESR